MKKILIVGSNFYKDIFKKQIKILEKNLKKNNIKFDKTSVPGIFEIPYKISKNLNKYKGFLAIGCAIKGKTDHYDLITNAKKSLIAGCNIVLYCAGNYKDTYKLIKEVPFIDKFTAKKTSEFYKFLI